MSSALLACFRKRQNVSSRSCREMFSNARRWSPGRSGGEIKRKNRWTASPSRLAKSTPVGADRHRAHQAIDARVLGVGDRHAAADPRASQFLPLQDGLDDALALVGLDLPRLHQRLNHLPDRPFLIGSLQLGADGAATDKVGKLHARNLPSSFPRLAHPRGKVPRDLPLAPPARNVTNCSDRPPRAFPQIAAPGCDGGPGPSLCTCAVAVPSSPRPRRSTPSAPTSG